MFLQKSRPNLIFIANFATLAFQYSVFGFRELKLEANPSFEIEDNKMTKEKLENEGDENQDAN